MLTKLAWKEQGYLYRPPGAEDGSSGVARTEEDEGEGVAMVAPSPSTSLSSPSLRTPLYGNKNGHPEQNDAPSASSGSRGRGHGGGGGGGGSTGGAVVGHEPLHPVSPSASSTMSCSPTDSFIRGAAGKLLDYAI